MWDSISVVQKDFINKHQKIKLQKQTNININFK